MSLRGSASKRLLITWLLRRGPEPQDIITKVSDAIRLELEKIDLAKYINTILTAHVVKTPPDHEAGLLQLLRLRGLGLFKLRLHDLTVLILTESDPDLVEEAVKYIIFLVDADRLFDTALGMYDFSLVLMIAQHAQKVAISFHHIRSQSLLLSYVPGSTRVSPIPERTPGTRQTLSEIPHRRPS